MLIISHKSKKEFTDFLDFKKIKYLKTIDNPNLDKRISDHPDLSIFKLDDKNLIVDKNVYYYYKKNLKNINVIRGDEALGKYPYDAIYNIFISTMILRKNISNCFFKKKILNTYL